MKVTHKEVKGTLITVSGRLFFIPNEDKYGPNRIMLEEGYEVLFLEDENSIFVIGQKRISTNIFERVELTFYQN